MSRIIIILLLCIFLLGACQSGKQAYSETLEKWRGQHIDELAAAWGPADSTHQNSDGTKLYRWSNRTLISRPYYYDRPWFSGWSPWAYSAYSPRYYDRWCETVITVNQDGYITDWSFRGNGCRDLAETISNKDDATSNKVDVKP